MMNTLRKSASGFGVKLLLAVVVLAFVVTGFSSFFNGSTSGTVISAGETEVSTQDYLFAFRQAEGALSQRLQKRPTREEVESAGIESQVVAQLASDAVLDEHGRRIGLGLSEDRLARLIADDSSFHDAAGNFSRAAFSDVMRSVGMRERDFIRNREEAAIRNQIVEAVAQGISAPALMKTAFGLYNGERRTVEYVTLAPSLVEPVAEPAADVLAKYFDANKDRYRAPEYRSVSYALLTPEAIADPAAVTDEAIKADYDASGQRYVTPERRRVQQIVYPDRKAADAAKTAIAGGTTFDQAIVQSGRTVADSDLGLLAKSDIPDKAVADAAFSLAANAVSDVVDGAFGPVLLRVASIEPEQRRPLAEVRDDIRRDLALSTATGETQRVYDAFEDARASGQTFEEAAKASGLAVKTVPALTADGLDAAGQPIADLPPTPDFIQAVFATEAGTENLPINLPGNGNVFYDVTKVDPARDRTLDEARERVVADWKSEETGRLLSARIEPLRKRLEGGDSLDAIAASESLPKSVAASLSRQSAPGEIGREAALAAFGGKNGLVASAMALDGRSRLLIKVTSVAEAADPLANVQAGQASQLDSLLENDLLQSYVTVLQNEIPVMRDPQAIERARSLIR